MNKYIGVYDSGLGGLTSVKQLIKTLPNENIVFFGDTLNVPYGSKTKEEIIEFASNNASFLNTFGLKAMVIACNTSDSYARNILEEKYDFPIFGVIKPACEKAISICKKKIGVIATQATINSNKYLNTINELNENIEVISIPTPELVPMIEDGKFNFDNLEIRNTLKTYLNELNDIDTLILGCTHYDVLEDIIKDLRPDINIVSSSKCVIDKLNDYLIKNDLLNTDTDIERKYFVSKDSISFEDKAKMIIKDIKVELKK